MILQLPKLPKLNERHLWHLLTVAAIVFAAGPSGAWLGQQFTAPLPYAWGWFGSILVGLTLLGGVNLAIRGDNWGKVIVGGLSVVAVVCDWHYFAPLGHDAITAGTLAIFATFIAIMGGVVASRWDSRQEQRLSAQESEQRQWERQQAEKQADWERQQREAEARREWAYKGKQLELEAKRVEQPSTMPVQAERSVVQLEQAERSKDDTLNDLLHYLHEHPNASLNAAAQVVGKSKSTVFNYVSELTTAGRLTKNGHGWEVN
jgi:hypothetical protein